MSQLEEKRMEEVTSFKGIQVGNSRIPEATGDISEMTFPVDKVKLPQ